MNKRVVTFGEIMLRLAPNGYYSCLLYTSDAADEL